jgi:hypothetical protein
MPELSTLVRQRLRATEDRSSHHPDPDVLTAYVEELLSAAEREDVLRHLSLCGDCREIVALTMPDTAAAPEVQAEAAPVVSAPARRWFLSPALGLAGSLAAVVLGVAFILHLPANAPQTANLNTNRQIQAAKPPAPAAPSATDGLISQNSGGAIPPLVARQEPAPGIALPESKAESARVTADLRSVAPVRRTTTIRDTREAAAAPVVTAQLQKQDYVNKMFLASENAAAAPAFRELPQAPVPVQPNIFLAPPSVVAGNGYSTAFEVSSRTANRNRGIVTLYSSDRQESRGATLLDKIVDLGKRPLGKRPGAAISSSSVGTSAMFRPGISEAQSADVMAAKSSDGGDTGVLANSNAFSSKALATLPRRQMLGAPQYQWKVVQGKLLRSSDNNHWTEENPNGETVQFSVVSSNGPEVWAGGDQAALMHSRDAGTTWERITLGAAAVGTIKVIEAAGQNIQVKSSSGQNWLSQDGGRSWILQD